MNIRLLKETRKVTMTPVLVDRMEFSSLLQRAYAKSLAIAKFFRII